MIQNDRLPGSKRLQLVFVELCENELWKGLQCTLRKGHLGPHYSPPSIGGCALSWRSTSSDRSSTG